MNNAARTALLLMTISTWSAVALGDRLPYSDSRHLQARAGDLVANHCHDWSLVSKSANVDGWEVAYSRRSPFGVTERVSNLELYEPNGRTLVRMTSPPLQYLAITPDARFVVGLSDVKFLNSTQLLVLDRSGAIVMRRQIRAEQFCFSERAFEAFRTKYDRLIRKMSAMAEVSGKVLAWRHGGQVLFDPIGIDGEPGWDEMFKEAYSNRCPSPYSANITESVSSWVHWYDRSAPNVEILQRDGKASVVRVRDPKGDLMEIPVQTDVVLPTSFRFVDPRLAPIPSIWGCSRDASDTLQ